MQAQLQSVALKTFVGSSVSNSLASILSSTGTLSDAVRKSYLTSVALNTGVSGLDALQGKIEDIARERKQLESQRTRSGGIAEYAKKRLAAAKASEAAYTSRERYTGVVWDHLDLASLTSAQQKFADTNIIVVSGLLGLVCAGDAIPDYRLKIGASLAPMGKLSTWWQRRWCNRYVF